MAHTMTVKPGKPEDFRINLGKEKSMEESSGFPLDDLMDDLEVPEPQDEWEKQHKAEKEAGAKLLAKAILAGGVDSEESIVKSILKFQDLGRVMRGVM